jgi:regulator of RNase E activity RraA
MFIDAPTDNLTLADPWERLAPELLDRFAKAPAANIGDVFDRLLVMDGGIRPFTSRTRLVGTALPILTRAGDNLAIHRALDDARPGDVLVINANSDTNRACFGDILGELCIARGIAGVVIDGATRDVDELRAMGLPIFARGISPAGPFKYGPGTIGAPVACGNVVCHPGDAIIGDSDGVVVVPKHLITAALERTTAQEQTEAGLRAKISSLVH